MLLPKFQPFLTFSRCRKIAKKGALIIPGYRSIIKMIRKTPHCHTKSLQNANTAIVLFTQACLITNTIGHFKRTKLKAKLHISMLCGKFDYLLIFWVYEDFAFNMLSTQRSSLAYCKIFFPQDKLKLVPTTTTWQRPTEKIIQ